MKQYNIYRTALTGEWVIETTIHFKRKRLHYGRIIVPTRKIAREFVKVLKRLNYESQEDEWRREALNH